MSLYLGEEKIKNISVGLQAVGVDVTGLNSETTTSFDGIIKGENGKATTAVPGVDYLAPDALNSLGSLANKNKVSESDLDDALKQTIEDASNIQLPEGIVQNNIVNTFTADGKITMADGYAPSNDGDVANKKWVEQQVKSAVPAFSNGPILFEKSGTFNPATYNLTAGDQIQVICIGGGAGGYGNDAAGASSVGGDYGCGGNGRSRYSRYDENSRTTWYYGATGGGGSGYLTKKLVTLDSTASIPVTIGTGGKASSNGGTTSFGKHLTAEGGKTGTDNDGSGHGESENAKNGTGGAGGHSASGLYGGVGWTVESYIVQNTSGSLNKGSGAVFIWY